MIDAKELRIGNWVSFKGLWKGKVRSITESGLIEIMGNNGIFDDENIQPIPITKELLYKIGAKDFSDGSSLELADSLIALAECRNTYYHVASGRDLISLHQLQNLFYALTGTELNITL